MSELEENNTEEYDVDEYYDRISRCFRLLRRVSYLWR